MLIMKYTLQKTNELFDVLYGHGCFLPSNEFVRAGSAALLVCESCAFNTYIRFLCFLSSKHVRYFDLAPWNHNPSKEGYLQLAALSFRQGKKLYKVRPKTHTLAEIGLVMKEQGENGRPCMSPIATCTWTDEDFIGRISRVSRSTHGATQTVSTMHKCLGLYAMQLQPFAAKKRS